MFSAHNTASDFEPLYKLAYLMKTENLADRGYKLNQLLIRPSMVRNRRKM